MGMVLNRFSTLKMLRDDKYYKQTHPFKLVGVIVHQEEDRPLQRAIQREFHHWANMTGEKFLFITFVNSDVPPQLLGLNRNKYVLDPKQLIIDDDTPPDSQEQTLGMLREYFGLRNDASYLMLAENLQTRHFSKVRITHESIEEQLFEITRYCESGDDSPSSYDRLIARLSGDTDMGYQPLSDTLLDVLALTARTDHEYRTNRYDQQEWIQLWYQRQYIRALESSEEERQAKLYALSTRLAMGLENFDRKHIDHSDLARIKECLDPLYKVLDRRDIQYLQEPEDIPLVPDAVDADLDLAENPYPNYAYARRRKPRDPLENLDQQSRDAYRTLKTLERVIPHGAEKWFNYSSLTVCINQIIETEIHLSVGQMMRYAMGIPMPKYFNLYSSEHGRVVVPTHDRTAFLNQFNPEENGVRQHQKSVPLGTLYFAYIAMIEEEAEVPYPERLEMLDEDLLDFWYDYSQRCRNQSSHTIDPGSHQTYLRAKNCFDDFLKYYSSTLAEIRERMCRRA